MMRQSWLVSGLLIALAIFIGYGSFFNVNQNEQALVLQFGKVQPPVRGPGLNFKIPVIQDVEYFDRRVLDYDPPAEEVIASDQKRLVVDAYTQFRIVDPLKYYQTVTNELGVRARLGALVNGALRRVIGNVTLSAILSAQRAQIMEEIRRQVNAEAKGFGIDVVDVRVRRADLPEANSQAIFARMQSERQRQAKQYRAEGAEEAQRIRAKADRDKVVLLAEAQRQSQITRGEGESDSVRNLCRSVRQRSRLLRLLPDHAGLSRSPGHRREHHDGAVSGFGVPEVLEGHPGQGRIRQVIGEAVQSPSSSRPGHATPLRPVAAR